jgi:U4/U6 small nuclear ribonucleoprotein PRP31
MLSDTNMRFSLQRIEHYTAHPEDTSVEAGPIEENPEYALIVQANNLSVELENELLLVHKVCSRSISPCTYLS